MLEQEHQTPTGKQAEIILTDSNYVVPVVGRINIINFLVIF